MVLKSIPPRVKAITTRVKPIPHATADHYKTPEHRAWARQVVARAGFSCQQCGATGVRLFADHVIELKDGGEPFEPANGRALCGSCHTWKTAQARAHRLKG